MDINLQNEYDKRFYNGQVARTLSDHEDDIKEMKEIVKSHDSFINQFKGSLNVMKYIISALGLTTIAQIIITISKIGG